MLIVKKSKIEERTIEFEQVKDKKKRKGDKYLNDLNRSHEKRWYQINYASQGNKKDEGIKCSKSVSLGNRADGDQP